MRGEGWMVLHEVGAARHEIATVRWPWPPGDSDYIQYESNARLIAAAPAMLEQIDALRADLKAVAEALARLYTYPGVRDVLAPIESLGSIAADVEEALSKPGVQAGLK